jgi:hypothetical protein
VLLLGVGIGAIASSGGDDDDVQASDETSSPTISEDSAETTVTQATSAPTTAETTNPPTTRAPSPDGTRESPISLGQATRVGDWTMHVTSVVPNAIDAIMAENQFNDPPAPGHQFFMVTLEMTYGGSTSGDAYSDFSYDALGPSNVVYEEFQAGCGVIPSDISDSGEAFPGGVVSGNVCWSVTPEDAAALQMVLTPTASFDDEDRTFFALV